MKPSGLPPLVFGEPEDKDLRKFLEYVVEKPVV